MAYVAESLASIGKKTGIQWQRDRGLTLSDISRDTGCKDGGPSCLECWLPCCLYEIRPQQRAAFLTKAKAQLRQQQRRLRA
jgi:hypothetical protein